MVWLWKRLSRCARTRKPDRRTRLGLEVLEGRTLLSGSPALTVSITPSSFNENAGAAAATGTVTRVNTDDVGALTVQLTSSNTSQATVPASVIIPAGQASTTFAVNAVDDGVVTGNQNVTITATAVASVPLSADTTFGSGGSASQNFITTATAVQSDGKVVAAGLSYTGNTTSDFYHAAIARYNADGTPDTTFGSGGTVITKISGQSDRIQAVLVQSDGKIVIGGYDGDGPTFHFEVARFNTNGTLDTSFGTNGAVLLNPTGPTNEVWDLAQQSDGKLLAAGDIAGSGFAVTRLNTDGSLDTTFGTAGVASDSLSAIYGQRAFGVAVQSDGGIVLAGVTGEGNYFSQFALVRFTSGGKIDSTFGTNGAVETSFSGESYAEAHAVDVQSDGKLVVAGYASPAGVFSPVYNFALARYNTDGTLDTSFGSGGKVITDLGGNDQAQDVAVQSDGTILVSGTTNSGTSGIDYHAVLARYESDGTFESKLLGPGGTAGQSMAVGSDGRVFVAGTNPTSFSGNLLAFSASASLSGSATVSVLETDHTPPVADAGPDQTVNEGATVTFDGSGSHDPDGDTLTYAWDFGDNTQGTGVNPTHVYTADGTYTVTLTVDDGNGDQASATMKVTVLEVAPTAGVTGPADGVRGQARTFTFTATDPSPADQAGTFQYAINWGDGTSSTVTGLASIQLSHVFGDSGTYQVSATASNADGGTSPTAASTTITIKSVAMQGTTMVIGGTTGNDAIVVKPTDRQGDLDVNINGTDQGIYQPTGQILIYTQDGSDSVKLEGRKIDGQITYVGVQALIFGGNGPDNFDVRGSSANNALVGGSGNDVLRGGRGRDLLIGGGGSDTLIAGSGGDLLIGGTTSYDQDVAALTAILAEWGRTDISSQARIADLMGTTTGGLNGSYVLNATTVQDDGAVDQLYGGGGQDWFIYDSGDVLHGRKHDDVATLI